MVFSITKRNTTASVPSARAEDDTRNAFNALTLSDENVITSHQYKCLMYSTSLGLQEIASSVISELQKNPKKKEVVVHVRVMRLCKDKKKKCCNKAKITKLSYRLKVNQKVLNRMIQKKETRRNVSI